MTWLFTIGKLSWLLDDASDDDEMQLFVISTPISVATQHVIEMPINNVLGLQVMADGRGRARGRPHHLYSAFCSVMEFELSMKRAFPLVSTYNLNLLIGI